MLNNINNIKYAEKHPIGFYCIELLKLDNGDSLSLHYWDNSSLDSYPHNHEFDSFSLILFGKLQNTLYKVEKTIHDTKNIFYKTYYDFSSKKREYIPISKASIKKESMYIYKYNNEYSLSKNEFHSVKTISKKTATLFIRKNRNKEHGSCIISTDILKPTLKEITITELEIKEIFSFVIKKLEKNYEIT